MSSSSVWGGLLRLSWWGVLLRWQEGESVEEVLWVMMMTICNYLFTQLLTGLYLKTRERLLR